MEVNMNKTKNLKKMSSVVSEGPSRAAARAMLWATGLTD